MPEKYWSEKNLEQELEPLTSIISEWSDPEEEEQEFREDFFQGLSGRRKKAAFTLMLIWSITISLHLVSWGYLAIFGLTGILMVHGIRIILAKPKSLPTPLSEAEQRKAATCLIADTPFISLIVAAKNEEAVIANLVKMLFELNYPQDKYEVWVVDDHSTDKTPEILRQLTQQYQQLRVLRRPINAGGGKSGALNQVLNLTQGDIIGVFDADAQVSPDLLLQLVPMFSAQNIGAVQVRKAIANNSTNFWTKGQMAEMALDSCCQQKRIAIGGIGELRGNGQFVRRCALDSCGGWNEETITDDLDLTIRLHLANWDIDVLEFPSVGEEGVTEAIALWHQRNRWAEGGYQRYLDYWRLIVSDRLSWNKKLDLFSFLVMQYLVPSAAIPDLLMMITRHRFPLFAPVTGVIFSLSFIIMFTGLRRINPTEKFSLSRLFTITLQSVRGMIYMLHWLIIMPAITARMSVRPKRLKWVKTTHAGEARSNG